LSRNNNTSNKDNFGTSKQTRNSPFYLKNRNNNPIFRKYVSTTPNNTNIVDNAKNDRKITMKTIDMVTSGKSYKNQTLKSNLDLYSKEHDDNVTRKSADTISTKDKGSVFTNSEYERMIKDDISIEKGVSRNNNTSEIKIENATRDEKERTNVLSQNLEILS